MSAGAAEWPQQVVRIEQDDEGRWFRVYEDGTRRAAEPPGAGRTGRAEREAEVEPPETRVLTDLRSRLLTSDLLDDLPPAVPLVDGVLYRDSLVELWGKPGCGKSFVAVDWAMSVATGRTWQDHETTAGKVLYIVGEGITGMAKRRRAWSYAWRREDGGEVVWVNGAVPLLDLGWMTALLTIAQEMQPALIVIDTVSRAIPGHNENAPETMSKLVEHADALRKWSGGACVLLVHHATKAGDSNRGHSALEGAADIRWKLSKDVGGLLTLVNEKSKDEAELPELALRLLPIELKDGQTSCVVESHGRGASLDERTASEDHVLAVMRDSFGTTGATGAQLRDACEMARTTYYRALNGLARTGSLRNEGTQARPFYVLPPEEVST